MPARFWTLTLSLLLAAAGARGEELQVTLGGRYHEPLTAYKVGGRLFINAKQVGELYGGQVYWYPVSGRVQFGFRSRVLQLVAGSAEASIDGRTVSLEDPVLLRAAQAYAPLAFFLGKDFSELSGMESRFDARARLLTVDRRSSVGGVRWYSYQDYTRVVLELKKPLGHSAAARGVQGVEVSIPFGVIESSEQETVDDGLVASFGLRQEPKAVRWSVRFARPGLKWRLRELSEPRRLALEISAADPGKVVPEGSEDDAPSAAGAPPAAPAAPVLASTAAAVRPAAAPAAAPVSAAVPAGEPLRRIIIIDAGHGGKDGGATGRRGTLEKDVNLAAAKELAKLLEQERVFEVMLTRNDDTFVPLDERSRLANDGHADLFVSLHCNAHRNARENGFEVYFMSEKASDPEAERLAQFENSSLELEGKTPADAEAELILHAMIKTESINAASELAALVARDLHKRVDLAQRGVKQAGFYVLRGTDAPAVLIEMAFLSNRRDEAKLGSPRYRSRLVDGIYAGLVDYAKRQGWLAQSARSAAR
ncbi:MAG: N-acetylmuramoyl-L-alanine amidase [Elusimicrobia bacterium]|nr:N-acetylmuramoyl-L-alanine amidase [Elusimicrobiota bacterium]